MASVQDVFDYLRVQFAGRQGKQDDLLRCAALLRGNREAETDESGLAPVYKLTPDDELFKMYDETLLCSDACHQFETELGDMRCLVYTNTPLNYADFVVLFFHGLGASPYHFSRIGTLYLQMLSEKAAKIDNELESQETASKAPTIVPRKRVAVILPFAPHAMEAGEFGAIEGSSYGSFKWWDIVSETKKSSSTLATKAKSIEAPLRRFANPRHPRSPALRGSTVMTFNRQNIKRTPLILNSCGASPPAAVSNSITSSMPTLTVGNQTPKSKSELVTTQTVGESNQSYELEESADEKTPLILSNSLPGKHVTIGIESPESWEDDKHGIEFPEKLQDDTGAGSEEYGCCRKFVNCMACCNSSVNSEPEYNTRLRTDSINSGFSAPIHLSPGQDSGLTKQRLGRQSTKFAKTSGAFDSPAGRHEARRLVFSMLNDLNKSFDISTKDVVISGFSQGAMLALEVFFNLRERPRLLALFSGAPMCVDDWQEFKNRLSPLQLREILQCPIFQSHGNKDWIFPSFVGRWLNRFLKRLGFRVKFEEFSGEHELPEDVVQKFYDIIDAVERPPHHGSLPGLIIGSIPGKGVPQKRNELEEEFMERLGFEKGVRSSRRILDSWFYRWGYALAACLLPVVARFH